MQSPIIQTMYTFIHLRQLKFNLRNHRHPTPRLGRGILTDREEKRWLTCLLCAHSLEDVARNTVFYFTVVPLP